MEFAALVYKVVFVVAASRTAHALYLTRGGKIKRKYKPLIAVVEYWLLCFLIGFGNWINLSIAAAPLFMGVRLFSDYQLNLMRGLPWDYSPRTTEKQYRALSDNILMKFNPQTQLAIRFLVLIVCGVISYTIFKYA